MGSVGSGVAGEQEFAMKSVGTRTTLPRAPPLSRRCPADRSCSADRLPPPPTAASEGTASSDERGSLSIGTGTGTGTCTGTERPLDSDLDRITATASNCARGETGVGYGNGAERRRERERERERERDKESRGRERENRERETREWEREMERERAEREREWERVERERERERDKEDRDGERSEQERERDREPRGGMMSLNGSGNMGGNDSGPGMTPRQHRDTGGAKPESHKNPPNPNPPKILPVSGKLEQNNSGLVRPSAFKPVVPKSFHSMQNLVGQTSGAGGEGRGVGGRREGGAGGGEPGAVPEALLLDQDSPGRSSCRAEQARGGEENGGVQGGMSDSGRNSLTSLPTYAGSGSGFVPPAALGPLSASTSHINILGTNAGAAAPLEVEKPAYQNGLNASDSGRSSSGKSSSSYQRLSHLGDTPAPLRPSPSSDDFIQDLEDRLWEKEQEVQHMRRNLDQSEAAIVQVFEEKQRVWERQMDELRQNYASRLQQVTRRAQRSQNALQAQITRLSQDKRRLQEEMAALLAQREELERKCLNFRKEQADILPRLEETKWEVCQKAGEISLLKQQLRESQAEVTQRAGEMVSLRGQLKEANAQLRDREEAMQGLKDSYTTKSLELERCQGELRRTLTEVSILREKLSVFEAEVLGLKRALGKLGGGVDSTITQNLGVGCLVPTWGALYSPQTHSEPPSTPLTPTSDTLLSLQSDEAKAQRQEAQRQERQQREEVHWHEMHPDAHQRQEARQRQEALQRQEAYLRQEAHLQQEAQLRKEAQLRQEAHLHQEAQQRHEAQREEWGNLREQLEQLQGALRLERQQRERQALSFDQERNTWIEEKERVLKYQAQLQVSYVETLQKNQVLEKQVGQLGAKLTPSPSSSGSPPPSLTLSSLPPLPSVPLPSNIALTLSLPPSEDQKSPPSLLQLPNPWAGPSRLERIESTEI